MYISLSCVFFRAIRSIGLNGGFSSDAESEELQLYMQCEPVAGLAAAICCLLDAFYGPDGVSAASLLPPNADWSPTADDIPAETAAGGETSGVQGDGPYSLFSKLNDNMLDAHYLCTTQNPLSLLLHIPATLLLKLLTENLLADIVLMLLLKLETYARMGAPVLPGTPPEPIAFEEIVQLQVSKIYLQKDNTYAYMYTYMQRVIVYFNVYTYLHVCA